MLGVRAAFAFPMTVFGALTNARRGFAWNSLVAASVVVATAVVTYVVLERGGSVVQLVRPRRR